MKNFLAILVMCMTCSVSAQFTDLYDFNTSSGYAPSGAVIKSDSEDVLYGMTSTGGSATSNSGSIYSIHIDGSDFKNLYNFKGLTTDGANPRGSLIQSGELLYGMTSSGGTFFGGTIFSIRTDGSAYTTIYNFGQDENNGKNPNGTLVKVGNVLFGLTQFGGKNNIGVIFSINTDGTDYKILQKFTNDTGFGPNFGALANYGDQLIGSMYTGGTSNKGVLFSIKMDGTGFTKLIDFNNTNGANPYNSVILSGNKIYGNTSAGGKYNYGLIYSINVDGTNYKDLYHFKDSNGFQLFGGLLLSGNQLYGTATQGGSNGSGTVYCVDTIGNGFRVLHHFDGFSGANPRASLIKVGKTLYGTCVKGGSLDGGIIFALKIIPPTIPICMVTVNENSKNNKIIWEKPITNDIDSFIIYREITSEVYKQIGAIPYQSLSEFIDTVSTLYFPFTGDPNAGTYRYKLQIRDKDGDFSNLSPYHNTIFVNQILGTFNWNHYTIEHEPDPLPNLNAYVLFRDDLGNGIWNPVIGVSGSQSTASDPNYLSYPKGRWRIETNWSISCTPTAFIKPNYNSSLSNIKGAPITGLDDIESDELEIIPIVLNDQLLIKTNMSDLIHVELYDLSGQKLFEQKIWNNYVLNISSFSTGTYIMVCKVKNRIIHKKIVITFRS